MNIIEWNDSELSVGIPMIDAQHKKMADMANEAYRLASEVKVNHLKLSLLFVELHKYVEDHCRLEEELMAKAGYAELPSHQKEHEAFFVNMQRLHSKHLYEISKGSISSEAAGQLLNLLSGWLRNHIITDRKYVPALRSIL